MRKRGYKYSRKPGAAPDEYWLAKDNFEAFDPSLLGLEGFPEGRETFEALAAIVDLKDFTAFCDQRDPHHEIPKFIETFRHWLFTRIKEESLRRIEKDEVVLWSQLPFFGKFLGDGVLLLWDASAISSEATEFVVQALDLICSEYQTKLFPLLKKDFTNPPSQLRCGIAQGSVT